MPFDSGRSGFGLSRRNEKRAASCLSPGGVEGGPVPATCRWAIVDQDLQHVNEKTRASPTGPALSASPSGHTQSPKKSSLTSRPKLFPENPLFGRTLLAITASVSLASSGPRHHMTSNRQWTVVNKKNEPSRPVALGRGRRARGSHHREREQSTRRRPLCNPETPQTLAF